MTGKYKKFMRIKDILGWLNALQWLLFYVFKMLGGNIQKKVFTIKADGLPYPLYARFGDSDILVYQQIYIEDEYKSLKCLMNTRFVVDCGANVGYATVYFLNNFPDSYICAIEPDQNNLAIAKNNLAMYPKARYRLIESAIWNEQCNLKIEHSGFSWATMVRKATPGEIPDLKGIDILSILNNSAFEQIDLLKIDIEGSEKYLFRDDCSAWLKSVKNLVIELHDQESRDVFFKAMNNYDYQLSLSGELTVCLNIRPLFRKT